MRPVFLAVAALLTACGGAEGGPRDANRGRPQTEDQPSDGLNGKVDEALSVQLAETLINAGAHGNAVPILRNALGKRPDDPRLHYLLGTILRDRGVYDQAEKELRAAIALDPKLSPAYSGLGILYDLQGEHDEARKHHLQAIELGPRVPRYHNNLGFSRYLAGAPEEAVAAYEEALRLKPSAARVYVNLGFAYGALGRDDDALRMFRQSMAEPAALNNLALAHELRGNREEARRLYLEATERDPRLKEALENLQALEQEEEAQP